MKRLLVVLSFIMANFTVRGQGVTLAGNTNIDLIDLKETVTLNLPLKVEATSCAIRIIGIAGNTS